jgi:hypothetical protein
MGVGKLNIFQIELYKSRNYSIVYTAPASRIDPKGGEANLILSVRRAEFSKPK